MKAIDVRNIENSFLNILINAPGTKVDKQIYFQKRNVKIPKTNYEIMWDSLVTKLGRVEAGNAVFEYLMNSAESRLKVVIKNAQINNSVKLENNEPMLIFDLFYNNGNPKRIGEHLLEFIENVNVPPINQKFIKIKKEESLQHEKQLLSDRSMKKRSKTFEYDVALSFAGENRDYVEKVAQFLKIRGVKVFYDKFKKVALWGKDLYVHLDEIYRTKAHYCVMFISKHYEHKVWTNHERKSAQARAFQEHKEYILPARFDETQIPGVLPTVGYINLNDYSPKGFADLIIKKLEGNESGNIIQEEEETIINEELNGISLPFFPSQDSEPLNIIKVRTKLGLLKVPEIKGDTRLEIWNDFRHMFPPITHKNLSKAESRYLLRVIHLIQEDFDDEEFWERGLNILGMISTVENKNVLNKIKKMADNIKEIYDDLPNTKNGKGEALLIFRNIARNKDRFCRELIEQSINDWSEEEFNVLRSFIKFEDLKNKEAEYMHLYKLRSELEEWDDEKNERVKKIIEDLNRYR